MLSTRIRQAIAIVVVKTGFSQIGCRQKQGNQTLHTIEKPLIFTLRNQYFIHYKQENFISIPCRNDYSSSDPIHSFLLSLQRVFFHINALITLKSHANPTKFLQWKFLSTESQSFSTVNWMIRLIFGLASIRNKKFKH